MSALGAASVRVKEGDPSISALGTDWAGPLSSVRELKTVFRETSRMENALKGLFAQWEELFTKASQLPLCLSIFLLWGRFLGIEEKEVIPFRCPLFCVVPGSSSCTSSDIAGRPNEGVGFCKRDIADWCLYD